MEFFINNWPFEIGDQIYIFRTGTLAVASLILLNIYVAIEKGGGIKEIILSMYNQPFDANTKRRLLRKFLLLVLVASFITTIVDINVNGMQIIDKSEIRNAI